MVGSSVGRMRAMVDEMEIDSNEIGPNKNGNRSEQMEIDPNKWKSVQTNGNRSEQMEIDPNKWKSVRTNGNRSEQMEIGPNRWKSIRTKIMQQQAKIQNHHHNKRAI
jgi:hypothetical protein